VIRLVGDRPAAVRRMLTFLYGRDYDDAEPEEQNRTQESGGKGTESAPTESNPPPDAPSNLLNNVEVYALADKYDITNLKKLAASKVRHCVECRPTTAALSAAVQLAYTSTPSHDRGLRDILVDSCSLRIDNESLEESAEFHQCMEVGTFAADLFWKLYDNYQAVKRAKNVAEVVSMQRQSRLEVLEQEVERLWRRVKSR